MSFCTQGLPGVAESTVSKSKGKPSPSKEKVPEGRMRGEFETNPKTLFSHGPPHSLCWKIMITESIKC